MAVIVPILSTFNAAGINAATGALGALGASLKRMGLQAAIAAGGIKAIGSAVDFVSDAVTSARDLDRNLFAMNTVFGDLNPQMVEFTKNAYNMGISQKDAAQTATYLGSMLKQAGFSMDDTAATTQTLTSLAQDLAITYGKDVSEALTAMTAMFRGEYDPIEKFGVAIKQNEVNTLLAAKSMGKLTGQALLNAQTQIKVEELLRRTTDAQGAYAAQAGTLYGVQTRLNAVFENTKSALGEELIPVLTRFTDSLVPLVNENAPKVQTAFKGLAKIIESLIPIVEPLVRLLGDLVGAFGSLLTGIAPLIDFLAKIVAGLLEFIAKQFESLARGIDQVMSPLSAFGAMVNDWSGSGITDWMTQFLDDLTKGSVLIRWIYDLWTSLTGQFKSDGGMGAALARERGMAQNFRNEIPIPTPGGGGGGEGNAKKKAADYIKEFYAALAEEDRKQRATLKLKSLGATQGVIESIIGSGEGWFDVYKSIIAGGKAAVAQVQTLFLKTKDGIKEVADAAEAAAEVAQKLREDALAKYADEYAIWQERIAIINEFKTAIAGILPSLKPLAFAEAQVGRFESAVVDSFGQIKDSILGAVANGVLTQAAADKLRAYADAESAVLSRLARQRDELRNKYDLAEALINETRSAVRAYANITSMLDQQTTMVTETVQTMVDGVRLTRTSTREQIVQGTNLVDSFKAVLEKTIAFGKNLKQLRALGLDKNLYKQIVDAGLDAGGQTAAAIIEGGAGTVAELNDLFGKLDAVGADIAETSATVMYNNGVDMVGGLLEGLKSQDAAIMSAAELMATTFATTFNEMMKKLIQVPSAPTLAPQFLTTKGKPDMTLDEYVAFQNDQLAASMAAGVAIDYSAANGGNYGRGGYIRSDNNVTVNITAGAIADQGSLPQMIVDALGTYTKQSGAGGLTRVLGL